MSPDAQSLFMMWLQGEDRIGNWKLLSGICYLIIKLGNYLHCSSSSHSHVENKAKWMRRYIWILATKYLVIYGPIPFQLLSIRWVGYLKAMPRMEQKAKRFKGGQESKYHDKTLRMSFIKVVFSRRELARYLNNF